jgi:hypothetical protein
MRTLTFALFVLLNSLPASAQEQATVVDSLHTVAGDLRIIEQRPTKYTVTLGGKVILKTDFEEQSNEYADQVRPSIHTYYKSESEGIGDFDEVVLLQLHGDGNACNGGPLLFLGLKSDGKSYSLSKAIDFCGGSQPIITWGANKVVVYIPGGPPNRGTGYIPPETWVYEKGIVKKLPSRAPRHETFSRKPKA